jgi:hypothetical protein
MFSIRGTISKRLSKVCTSEGKGEEKRGFGRFLRVSTPENEGRRYEPGD